MQFSLNTDSEILDISHKEVKNIMFWNKESIVEKIGKVPETLADISEDIFGGISVENDCLHRVSLSGKQDPEAPYVCRGLYRDINIEQALMYPYIDSAFSNEYAVHPTRYSFMLPYEIAGEGLKKGCRVIPPEELKERYPLAYSRIAEFRELFHHADSPLESPGYYGLHGRKMLEYVGTPRLVVTDSFRLQACYDASGKHIFEEGCGIVLKDPSRYHYVLAALNSSVARTLPAICKMENPNCGLTTPAALKRFPIAFPDDELIESLISTISRYLIYIHGQVYAAGPSEGTRNLLAFYARIVNLLVLDTYLTNDLDPRFLEILADNIPPLPEKLECESGSGLMSTLRTRKENILDTPDFGKCRFTAEFTNILATLKNNGVW